MHGLMVVPNYKPKGLLVTKLAWHSPAEYAGRNARTRTQARLDGMSIR